MIFFRKRKQKSLNILLTTNSLILLATAMLAPIYAIYVEDIGGSLLDASLTAGALALAAGITSLFAGKLTDRTNNKKIIIVIGYLVICLGFFLYLFVNSIWLLLLVQILLGFGQAFYAPAFDVLYSEHTSRQRRGIQWGMWESMFSFTTAFGAVAGGIIATFLSFSAIFILMGLMCLFSAIYIYHLPKKIL